MDQHKPSRFDDDETVGGGGVPLIERRLRSLCFRFLSFFFFLATGVIGSSGDNGSTIGDCNAAESYDIDRDALRCFFFFAFFRRSFDELMELVDRCGSRIQIEFRLWPFRMPIISLTERDRDRFDFFTFSYSTSDSSDAC